MEQVHKRFSDQQVRELLGRYVAGEIERKYAQEILGIKKRRFFRLLAALKQNPVHFSIAYARHGTPRTVSPEVEHNIVCQVFSHLDKIA